MARQKKYATEEEKRVGRAEYMRQWLAKRREKILAAPARLCACGCGEPVFSYNRNAKFARGHWTLGKEFGDTKKAAFSPNIRNLEWAAGFLEGEGSFMATTGKNRYVVHVVSAPQSEEYFPLEKLRSVFGGKLSSEKQNTKNGKLYRRWYVHQARARGLMMTLYSFMSPKRQGQIRDALSKWERRNVKYWELGPKKYREL